MKTWILVLTVWSSGAFGQTVHDRNGDLILRLSRVDGRTVAHDAIGDLVGTWKQEGGFLVRRAPDGALLERVRR
jgi:hypothetical protein